MNMLKRDLAPIPSSVWGQIDERAKAVLSNILSARKVVHVEGPMGWDYAVVPEGRLNIIEQKEANEVSVGTYKVKPLVEARVSFDLERWELDNVVRGAKDINLDALDEATKKLALFEENLVYNGYAKGQIKGLGEVAVHTINLGNDASSILEAVSEARFLLMQAYAEKPYTLVVGKEVYKRLNSMHQGYPLMKSISAIINGNVVISEVVEGALLLPFDHEDFELTIGQDFSIGYEYHDKDKIRFFITESLTFRVLDEKIIVKFNI